MATATQIKQRPAGDPDRDLLSVTAFFSALLHAILILAVTFKFPEIGARTNTDNTLDVVLLSRNNEQEVDEADLVSDTDNLGGGPDELEGSTALPWEEVQPSPIDSIEKTAQQSPQNQVNPDQFVTADTSTVSLTTPAPEETALENKQASQGEDLISTQSRRLMRERLLAKIAQTQKDYEKRPRKKFHSPTTKASGAARYIDSWKRKVVRLGNANYPVQIKAEGLSGTLTITIEILRNGMINDIQILTPSKHRILNEAAKRIIRDAAPFDTFPDNDYFKGQDILVITRMIHFLPDNKIRSTGVEPG